MSIIYDGDVSPGRFRHLADTYGVRFAIVGCQVGLDGKNYTRDQMQSAMDAGLVVPAVYEFLYWNDSDLNRIRRATQYGRPVYLDVETYTPWGGSAVVNRIAEARDYLKSEGLYGGLYSNLNWWQTYTGNSQQFAGDNGWVANWPYAKTNGTPVLPPVNYLPDPAGMESFGGLKPVVWQYADTCYDEPSFDMNSMDLAAIEPAYTGTELDERRAKAIFDNAALFDYRCQWVDATHVRFVNNDGSRLNPDVVIDVSKAVERAAK